MSSFDRTAAGAEAEAELVDLFVHGTSALRSARFPQSPRAWLRLPQQNRATTSWRHSGNWFRNGQYLSRQQANASNIEITSNWRPRWSGTENQPRGSWCRDSELISLYPKQFADKFHSSLLLKHKHEVESENFSPLRHNLSKNCKEKIIEFQLFKTQMNIY